MKKIVWLIGALLLLSLVAPHVKLPEIKPTPVQPAKPAGPVDERLVSILAAAAPADKSRIVDVYRSLEAVLRKDNRTRITTSEQWAEVHAATLQLAIDTPGKYPDLDAAIEAVFLATVGTDDVLPNNEDTHKKLMEACNIIANSASR